ncbi:alpha/beta fold hydrolase [Lysinibacillus odysseyi]|uniref:Hydrolase n=1 Tax=Lysinibacillus odysseyi 34hs-1 = NBRC 100172 TaxID=1220589 RepID=A0A0A3IFG4_9BACI|nr:alpha/beta hydrolase [Lysinibacillus odysseyi]KGR81563.1 hydrolase [Lysinibacillus odysseyi 34hs-1 = NBRC 100172]
MLHYERMGNKGGDTIVMIHGFLGGSDMFHKAIKELEGEYDIISVDLPGHGKSKMESDAYTVYDYAKAIAEVLKHEKVANATWLGHSMGGYITLAALEKGIADIDKAILAYSSAAPDSTETQKKRDQQKSDIELNGVKAYIDNGINAFFGDNPYSEDVEFASRVGYEATAEGLQAALDAMKSRPDQTTFIHEVSIPILVIEGSQDSIVAPIETENIAVQKITTDTGHLGMLEDSKAFAKAVKQFLG